MALKQFECAPRTSAATLAEDDDAGTHWGTSSLSDVLMYFMLAGMSGVVKPGIRHDFAVSLR